MCQDITSLVPAQRHQGTGHYDPVHLLRGPAALSDLVLFWVFWGIKNAIKHWHHCSNKSKSLAVHFATSLLPKHACGLYV